MSTSNKVVFDFGRVTRTTTSNNFVFSDIAMTAPMPSPSSSIFYMNYMWEDYTKERTEYKAKGYQEVYSGVYWQQYTEHNLPWIKTEHLRWIPRWLALLISDQTQIYGWIKVSCRTAEKIYNDKELRAKYSSIYTLAETFEDLEDELVKDGLV